MIQAQEKASIIFTLLLERLISQNLTMGSKKFNTMNFNYNLRRIYLNFKLAWIMLTSY